jgi:hypothetical protein
VNTMDLGQSLTIAVPVPTTGTSPYTYSWVQSGCSNFVNPGSANQFVWTPSAASNPCWFGVTVTDSATTLNHTIQTLCRASA